jgi:hypothetical protein
MRRLALVLAGILIAGIAHAADGPPGPPPQHHAPSGPQSIWHNGSLMTLYPNLPDGSFEIRYTQPRPALYGYVVPGTLLVKAWWDHGAAFGTAFVFALGCPPFPFEVSGAIQGDALVMHGYPPVPNEWCEVMWYDPPVGNGVLVFTHGAPQ